MSLSKIDLFYRRLILTKFYTRGWGKPEELRQILALRGVIANRKGCTEVINTLHCPITLDKPLVREDCTTINGSFSSPMCALVPDMVPEECKISHFQLVLPPKVSKEQIVPPLKEKIKQLHLKPVCIHMAGTGDHGFARRRELLAKPLLKSSGISSLLLENPYYGKRKPKEQTRSGLLHVKDLFVMGGCLILEAQILLRWLAQEGYGPLGLTGISMGGHMASLSATNWPDPLALIPCMSWTSSSVVWTEGVLSKAIPWRVLETQYAKEPEYETQINEIIEHSAVDSYELGKDYVKDKGCVKPKSAGTSLTKPKKKAKDDKERRQQQTLLFMKGVMDQMTDLQNFSVPFDPTMVTFVVAKADAYYPLGSLRPMDDVWPGCEVRFLNTGHIAGFLIHHPDFCAAICDTFVRLIEKYYVPKKINDTGERPALETSGITLAEKAAKSPSLKSVAVGDQGKETARSSPSSLGVSLYRSLKVFAIKS